VRTLTALLLGVTTIAGTNAAANCGSAMCAVSTNWNLQGIPPAAGSGRVDLRYEYINQSQPWLGSSRTSSAGDEEATELKTINNNLIATVDYALSQRWGVTAVLPVVARSHSHTAEPDTNPTPESWKFTRVGDARLLASWRDADEAEPNSAVGLQFGFKLPTGPYDVANANGVVAERSLQPGTGSTDLLAGAFITRPARNGALWFAQVNFQWAVATREDYRPGNLFVATGGYRHPLSTHVTGIIQVNATVRASDSGANAEPDVTGGQFLFVSPGVSWDLSPLTEIYSYVQLPVYRHTTGAQLTFNWALVAGISRRF
jgi:hypothetical protein